MIRRLLSAAVVAGVLAASNMAVGATRVVVLPFAGVSPAPTRDAWMAGAVQQNMIMSLGQSRGLQPVAYTGRVAGIVDATVAARAATAGGGDLAVFGTYEVVGEQVRLTAQLVDASGQSLGGARVTGTADKLLSMEDDLAEQVRAAVANPTPGEPARPAVAAATPAAEPANFNNAVWTGVDNAPYTSPYYNYGYSPYRYLGYGYTSPYTYPWGYSYPIYSGVYFRGSWCRPLSFGETWQRIHSGNHSGWHGHRRDHGTNWSGTPVNGGFRGVRTDTGFSGGMIQSRGLERMSAPVSPMVPVRSTPSVPVIQSMSGGSMGAAPRESAMGSRGVMAAPVSRASQAPIGTHGRPR